MKTKRTVTNIFLYALLSVLMIIYMMPVLLVFMNSFKNKLYINTTPFLLPDKESFVGIKNYIAGLAKIHFLSNVGYSFIVTVGSIALIVFFCAMAAWIIIRIKSKWTTILYYIFVGSMVVPFQMIMYTLTRVADTFHLNNLIGVCFIYLGIGAGQSLFIFSGFVKTVPVELEEAALIDGATPFHTFFRIVFPVMKPILMTVAILNAMWVWNDFLLPYLIIGSKFQTIPIAVQNLRSAYGSIDYGHLMAVIIIALIPVSVFYFSCQKYIIEGIVSGAVKG